MLLPIGHDALGQCGPDAVQRFQLGGVGGVDVHLAGDGGRIGSLRLLRCILGRDGVVPAAGAAVVGEIQQRQTQKEDGRQKQQIFFCFCDLSHFSAVDSRSIFVIIRGKRPCGREGGLPR